jgi:pyridoxamine 5'-phosphate oxidase
MEAARMGNDGAFSTDPWHWFRHSFARAQESETFDPTRAALATVDAASRPSVRFVLAKAFDERGVAFFTNLQSAKAQHLSVQPHAALAFHWASIEEQVRFEGAIERVSEEEADAYYATRPRGSQISAWASAQSQVIASRAQLQANAAEVARRFANQSTLARPEFWGGYRLVPTRIEFWHNRDDRLHDRWLFTRREGAWMLERLQP